MGGRPQLRHAIERIESAAAAAQAESPEVWLFDRLANGETVSAIAIELQLSRTLIYQWIRSEPERREALKQAREVAAECLVEDAGEIADGLGTAADPETVAAANVRIKWRQWLSERFGKPTYGQDKGGAGVTVNIGSLHLQALEHGRGMVEAPTAQVARALDAGELVIEPAQDARQLGTDDSDRGDCNDALSPSADDTKHVSDSDAAR